MDAYGQVINGARVNDIALHGLVYSWISKVVYRKDIMDLSEPLYLIFVSHMWV